MESISSTSNTSKFPALPVYDFVIDDSPLCHQSLKHWSVKSNDLGSTVRNIATSMHIYQETGARHHVAGNSLSESLSNAAKTLKNDKLLEEPLTKFADAFNRIECYRDMLLTQTDMLGVQPMVKMVKDFEKMKKCKTRLTKASETLHVSWEKFAALPNQNNIQDASQLDKQAHNMITARQRYQLLLSQYIYFVRDANTRKRVLLLKRLLEHMLAEFSFYNYCSQILKELEPFMNTLFESIQKEVAESAKTADADEELKRKLENEVDMEAQSERKLFPSGDNWVSPTQSTGRFFNKVGGFISSGVKEMKKQYKDSGGTQKSMEEPDWEVIDDPNKKQQDDGEQQNDSIPHTGSFSVDRSQFYFSTHENINGETPQYMLNRPEEKPLPNDSLTRTSSESKTQTSPELPAIATSVSSENDVINNSSDQPSTSSSEEDGFGIKIAPMPDQPSGKFNSFPFQFQSTHEDEFCKKGYLRIKQKAFPKSKYPLLYFILDKKYGEMLSQGQEQQHPSLFAKLMLSSVRQCDVVDVDRNYCFQLITSDSEHTLQARNAEECQSWVKAIQEGIATALDGNQDRKRTQARGRSMKDNKDPRNHSNACANAVERIKAVDGNLKCADCDCPRPGWASASIGVVICIECSGIHRGLGVHISKVKSLSLDKWDNDLVKFMEEHGNTKVNAIYEGELNDHPKITRNSSKTERLEYIKLKYVEKAFMRLPPDEIDNTDESLDMQNLRPSVADESKSEDLSVMCLIKDCHSCQKGIAHDDTESDVIVSTKGHPLE